LRSYFRTARILKQKYAIDLDEFDRNYLVPILKAIQAKDWGAFEKAFTSGVDGSYTFHAKYGYDYIKFVLPKSPPPDLYLGPQEDLKRGKGESASDR
jgi:hypothetical protein